MNHSRHPNAKLTAPNFVREKWRIGFLALTDIAKDEEVMWYYHIKEPDWTKACPVKGVVETAEAAGDQEEDDDERRETKGKAPATSRLLCYCPVEGCTSNHLEN